MSETIRARVRGGVLEPLEPLDLAEGKELIVTISETSSKLIEALERAAGGWAGVVDGEQLKRDIYNSRSVISRPEPRL